MASVRTFAGLTFIPVEWREACGIGWHGQGEIVVQAWSKSDASGMLEDRGVRRASDIMADLRWLKGSGWKALDLLRDSGVVPADAVGVWAFRSGVKGDRVALIEPDGTSRTVAVFGYDKDVTVERVNV